MNKNGTINHNYGLDNILLSVMLHVLAHIQAIVKQQRSSYLFCLYLMKTKVGIAVIS